MSSRSGARSRARISRPTGRRGRTSSAVARRAPSPLETALDESSRSNFSAVGFADLGVPAPMVSRLAGQGITQPTEVQCRTLPDALAGRDLLGRAQTGSGKTLAFGLPIVAELARDDRRAAPGHPQALVLAPTRELAQQVADSIEGIARAYRMSVLPIYGGASMDRQLKALRRGADIVVATPGRLEDHMKRGTCSLSKVRVFTIDEADHMADLGFLPAVTRILRAIPHSAQRLLFSATLDRGIEQLATQYLRDPAVHAAAIDTDAAGTMEHRAFTVAKEDKIDVAATVARRHGRTLFFVRTKHGADRLAKQLHQRGIESGSIHGNRSQSQRRRALDDFASGRRPVLVATDVAARGIHVDGVDLVVHFDPPGDHKDYLHRSGRTARAGRDGLVLSLVLPHEQADHARMHRQTTSDHEVVPVDPTHPHVRELATGGTPVKSKSALVPDGPALEAHAQGARAQEARAYEAKAPVAGGGARRPRRGGRTRGRNPSNARPSSTSSSPARHGNRSPRPAPRS